MSNSANLGLPYLQASQAQKHVTVNEALERLDAIVALNLVSKSSVTPPGSASEGDAYAIADGAIGNWAGRDGEIAYWANGNWEYVSPARGWSAWVADEDCSAVFDGSAWQSSVVAMSLRGAMTKKEIVEFEVVLGAGPSHTVGNAIPAGTIVDGVSGRVTAAITGAATTWRVGVAGSDDRYGTGIGVGYDASMTGMTSSPLAYYGDTDLLVTAEGGDFAAGSIRMAIHLTRMSPPSA